MHRADDKSTLPHAVSRLRTERMARSAKPFLARGGIKGQRCPGCRLVPSHCMCLWRPQVSTSVGMCLLMSDIEPLKPSNTGWLIADVIRDTFAFGWSRTEVDSGLMALLTDFQWEAYLVFPDEFVSPERVVYEVEAVSPGKRPLFILLDATWPEARKIFRKSPYLNNLPVLSLNPCQPSRYLLRRSRRDDHLCTSEVASLCLDLAKDSHAAVTLEAYLAVYTHHYLQAKHRLPPDLSGTAHVLLSRTQSGVHREAN